MMPKQMDTPLMCASILLANKEEYPHRRTPEKQKRKDCTLKGVEDTRNNII